MPDVTKAQPTLPPDYLMPLPQLSMIFELAIREDRDLRSTLDELLRGYQIRIKLIDVHVATDAVHLAASVEAPSHYRVALPLTNAGRTLRIQMVERPSAGIDVPIDPTWKVYLPGAIARLQNGVLEIELPRQIAHRG